jgi:hypothetical protein
LLALPYLIVSPLSFDVLLNVGQNTHVTVDKDIVVIDTIKERVSQYNALQSKSGRTG